MASYQQHPGHHGRHAGGDQNGATAAALRVSISLLARRLRQRPPDRDARVRQLLTIRDAADRDYRILVRSDLCADRDPEVHTVLTERA